MTTDGPEAAELLLGRDGIATLTDEGREKLARALCATLRALKGDCRAMCPMAAQERAAVKHAIAETSEALDLATEHVAFLRRRINGPLQLA